MKWAKASSFVPAIWLAPRIQDKAACAAAVGRYVIGTLQHYEAKQNPKFGNMDHFYQILVSESSETEAHMYDPDNKTGDGYSTVAATFPELYSIKASGLLHHLLSVFWNNPEKQGCPLKITYIGTKDLKPVQKPGAPEGVTITPSAHQYDVQFDEEYIPQLAAPAAAPQLGHDAPPPEPTEEPLPPFDPEA